MPEYLHPGVYIEEIERGPRPIEGVSTSTAAFLGETERGPVWPTLVTSYSEYLRWFGGVFGSEKYMPYAASGFFDNGGKRTFICRIVGAGATEAFHVFDPVEIRAVGPGSWARRTYIKIGPSTTEVPTGDDQKKPLGFRIKIWYWNSIPKDGGVFDPEAEENRARLPRPSQFEDWDDLSYDAASQNYFEKRIKDNSALISVKVALPADGSEPKLPDTATGSLDQEGADGDAPGLDQFVGDNADANSRTGLSALLLDDFREVALVYAPGISDKGIVDKIVTHCENQKFRFAVIDSVPHEGNYNNLDPRTKLRETQYAAFYYPWIEIADPQTNARKGVPPGGHVLGIYARTDIERGVFKAPANEIVRGALDTEYAITDQMQDTLNPRGVNAIRTFPGRGIRVWGARTLSSNALWKYVSVRRLFIFLEHSIYDGTQWVVFEPNDERLWARVKDTIRLFLRTQWRNGAMMGTTEQQAFFITCDRTIMTQDDILNGRLICEIGIAPVRPAEFVIFRIFQNTAEAQT